MKPFLTTAVSVAELMRKIFLSFLEANIVHGNQKQDHNSNANKLTMETLLSKKLGRVPWSTREAKDPVSFMVKVEDVQTFC